MESPPEIEPTPEEDAYSMADWKYTNLTQHGLVKNAGKRGD